MSVSIALVPVALVLRVVMGKEKFDAWVRSQQVRVPSSFQSDTELTRAVKMAGYDCEKFGPLFKSHLPDRSFCFWERSQTGWEIVFSINHDRRILRDYCGAVEQSAGRVIFQHSSQEQTPQPYWPTNFSDRGMLLQTLTDLDAEPTTTEQGDIVCTLAGTRVRFFRDGNGPFSVEIRNNPDLKAVFPYLLELEDEYRRSVQAAVYQKVKRSAGDYGFLVESEEVLEDKSVVLTLRVS